MLRKENTATTFFKVGLGFTSIVAAGIEKAQCVICNGILSAESKPNKLKRHSDTKHPNFARIPICLRTKLMTPRKADLISGASTNSKTWHLLKRHYRFLSESQKRRPHTIAEDYLLPATKDIVRVMFGVEYAYAKN